jgi:hypothetical protein
VESGHEGKVTISWNQQEQTDRTISTNKRDIVIRDNKKATCLLTSREHTKTQIPYSRNTVQVEYKRIAVTSKKRGNWNHLRVTQKIPEQYAGEAHNQGTTENSHIGYSTHASERTDVKVWAMTLHVA